jgi:hypothetical protein
MSKGLERLQGRIVSLGTNSWLVRRANGDTRRVTTGTALQAAGHFVLGDEIAIHVTADRQAVLAEHTGEDRRASFKRSIGDMRKRTGASFAGNFATTRPRIRWDANYMRGKCAARTRASDCD